MSYIDGYLLAVPSDRKEDYKALAEKAGPCSRNGVQHGMSNAGVTTSLMV